MPYKSGQVSVGTSATAVFTTGPAPENDGVLISSSAAAFVGGSGVTTSTGFPVAANTPVLVPKLRARRDWSCTGWCRPVPPPSAICSRRNQDSSARGTGGFLSPAPHCLKQAGRAPRLPQSRARPRGVLLPPGEYAAAATRLNCCTASQSVKERETITQDCGRLMIG